MTAQRTGGHGRGVRLLRWAAVALPFLALALATPALRDLPPLEAIEGGALDWRYGLRGPRTPSAPVTVVAVDDVTLEAQSGWPVPRDVLGEAIRRLGEAGASVIAVDLLMAEPSRQEGADRALGYALHETARTLLPVAFTFGPDGNTGAAEELSRHSVALLRRAGAAGPPQAAGLLAPVAPLRQAAAGIGHVNVVLGPEGALRHLHPAIAVDGETLPALPILAVQHHWNVERDAVAVMLPDSVRFGDRRVPLGPGGRWTFDFYGPRGSFPTISLQSVLDGALPEGAVEGRIVWIGATATAVGDSFVTPFDSALPGVEAFATATANLLDDTFLLRDTRTTLVEMLAVLAVGLLTVRAARFQPAWLAVAATPVPLAAWAAATAVAFAAGGVWLNLTLPGLAGVVAAGTLVVWRLLLGERQRRRLASYLPQPLAEALAEADTPAFEGRRQHAAVLFADLCGFTGRSEAGTPEDTVALLRPLHATFDDCVTAHGGYVDSFAGDGAMLVFGVPEPDAADAAKALACAHDLLARGEALGLPIRIGLHCGEVQVARLGGRRHRQLSLAGDTVNLASRLMEVAKSHDAALAVSGPVAQIAREHGAAALLETLHYLSDEPIRGRCGRVEVWLRF